MVGCGGIVIAGGAGYCTANLCIPGYTLPWETDSWNQPAGMASPLQILIEASNGASDYGNCFGEPVITGFVHSCEHGSLNDRRSWHKPIMYSVGMGQIDQEHINATDPQKGMHVVLIGGPAYTVLVSAAAQPAL